MTEEAGAISFGTTRIDYRIQRSSRRRTLTISVDPVNGVLLRAPASASPPRIRDVVRTRAPWILQRIWGFQDLGDSPAPREFVAGESYWYLGRHYRLKIARAVASPLAASLHGGFLVVDLPPALAHESVLAVRRAVIAWYRRQASRRLPERVGLYAAKAGISPPAVLIRDQEKRWGSCSNAKVLRFNWRLIMAPMSLVDYVVSHEVCHLLVRDHSNRFWKTLRTILPDYEERRERLRRQGAQYQM